MQLFKNLLYNRSFQTFIPYVDYIKSGILWTLVDSLGSQGLVVLYHFLFRSGAGATLHGVMGCLLSILYLCITIANIGLNSTLAPFLETFTQSRKHLQVCILALFIPQLIFIGSLSILVIKNSPYILLTVPVIRSLKDYLSDQLILFFVITFIVESMRKTLRVFLQLSFYFRLTALIELLGMIANFGSLFYFYHTEQLSLILSWKILAYTSFGQLLLLIFGMFSLYRSLPETLHTITDKEYVGLFKRITSTRLFTWVLQCLNQVYSGNFLVPICAQQFGIESASVMKVITSVSHWITLIAKKVFGVTSNALFAHIKSRSPATQKQAFHFLSHIFNQALFSLLIFLLINGKKLAFQPTDGPPTVTWSLLYFMLILTFIESFFILYEQWYILEEDAHSYLAFNAISFGILYIFVYQAHSPTAILTTIIILRVITFIILTLFSFYRWHIWPSAKLHLPTLIVTSALSIFYYVLF